MSMSPNPLLYRRYHLHPPPARFLAPPQPGIKLHLPTKCLLGITTLTASHHPLHSASIPYIFPIEHVMVHVFPFAAKLCDKAQRFEKYHVPSGIMVGDLIQQLGGGEGDWLDQITFEDDEGGSRRYWVGRRLGWRASESLRDGYVGIREGESVLWLRWWRDPGEVSA